MDEEKTWMLHWIESAQRTAAKYRSWSMRLKLLCIVFTVATIAAKYLHNIGLVIERVRPSFKYETIGVWNHLHFSDFREFTLFFFIAAFLFDAYFLWCWADARSVIKEIARKLPAECPCPMDCSKRGWKSKISNYAIWILTVFFYVYLLSLYI